LLRLRSNARIKDSIGPAVRLSLGCAEALAGFLSRIPEITVHFSSPPALARTSALARRSPGVPGALATVLLTAATLCGVLSESAQARGPQESLGTIHVQRLPKEAQHTLENVKAGGPFAYSKDGTRFGNYERRLPLRARSYYREYTVRTPGVRHRGARRIVCGGNQRLVNECYYTEDHYNSFKRITQ
jgi:ribonuclease T1